MRLFLLGLLLLILSYAARCQVNADRLPDDQLSINGLPTDRLLNRLNQAIEASPKYDAEKWRIIDSVKNSLLEKKNQDLSARYAVYLQLFEQYKVFNYDSSYTYAKKLLQTALQLKDSPRIIYAQLKMGFALLSAGMFKETFDSLSRIRIGKSPDSIKVEYYGLLGRYYYDLGAYDNDSWNTPAYTEKSIQYMDSAMRLSPAGSFALPYYTGFKAMESGNTDTALICFKELLDRHHLSWHELAIATSTMSAIYVHNGQTDEAIGLLIQAAIADIRNSTKETTAMFILAQLLYKRGDFKNASAYIEAAVRDAGFYGARQRKVQLSAILPLIEGENVSRVEGQKKLLITYSVIATILLLLVIVLAFTVYRQVNKLKSAQKTITGAHIKEQAINQRLLETNYKLSEANKIKEEYIGYFFNTNSEFFGKIEKFKKSLEQKLAYRKWEDIIALVNNINLKKEKEELLQNFDKAFLKLFPDFIKGFNALFREEDQVQLKDHEFLNTDLRIFALIRMGIHDNEKIAGILEYSVNTINTYKTKIKNKSIVPNEDFEHRIMEIKTL